MPFCEQLALIGESDNQKHFTSETWGLLTFYPTKSDKWKETYRHCLLWDSELGQTLECDTAHCRAESRKDGQNGFYSIRNMPKYQ